MWEGWIERYGPMAVLVGALLEGETVFVLAGYAIARGYLDPLPTYLLATLGGTLSDSIYYWIGRRFGAKLVRGRPTLRPYRARAVLLLRRWGHAAAFLNRFAYGLRVLLPIVMGATRMKPTVFHPFNLGGSLSFALVYMGVGFLFGEAVEDLLARIRLPEPWLLLGLAALGLAVWLAREWKILHTPEDR